MKILVTGGAGFIGTNLIKRLLKEKHEVWSIDSYISGKEENHVEGCKYIFYDVTELEPRHFRAGFVPGGVREILDSVDVIFHLAALARIQPSLVAPHAAVFNNVHGTLNILNYAKRKNTQVIYAGSSSYHHGLYGSPYAWSKHSGEQLCKLYSEVYQLNTSICRFYNVYGPHQLETGDYSTVIGIFERQMRDEEPLTITGTGEQRRDFTHVDDIVDGLYRCMGKEFKAEIFELGRGENHSINEIADMFGGEKEYIPARKGEYDITLCDYTKAKEMLGWVPKINLPDYIQRRETLNK